MADDDSQAETPRASLAALAYEVAYYLLPGYAFQRVGIVAELLTRSGERAGAVLYVMACRARRTEPLIEDGLQFRFHRGELDDGVEYYALEYPWPPPVEPGFCRSAHDRASLSTLRCRDCAAWRLEGSGRAA